MLGRTLLLVSMLATAFVFTACADDGSIVITTSRTVYPGSSGGYSGLGLTGPIGSSNPLDSDQQSSDSLLMYQEFYDFGLGSQSGAGPVQFNIDSGMPTYLIINGQSKPYDPNYVPSNSLWIQGRTSWTQYMKCPLNAWFKMLAFSQGGPTTMVEIYPDGHPLVNQYSFYRGYTQLLFEADKIGRHTLTFYAYGQQSNSIIVDVVPYSGPYTFGNVPPSGQPSSSSVSISIGYTGQGAGQTQGNGCDITGTWSFGTNGPYNIIYADGSIEAKNAQGEIFDTGTWNVIDASRRVYGFSWQSGWEHTFTLSADCSSLDGSGKLNGGTEQPGHGTRVSSSGSGGYSTTGTGNAGQGQGVGSDPFSTPGSILIDSADQGFDPNAHIGGLLTDSAEDLGYSTGGELI